MALLRVLHLVGSPTNQPYCDLSVLYANGCIEALRNPARFEFLIALVTPDGLWRFPVSLVPSERDAADQTTTTTLAAAALDTAAALAFLAAARIDVAVPHLFCLAGMTHYRALLDVLGIAYIGNRPFQMALAADKAKTRTVVAAAGVRVPAAQLLYPGDAVVMPLPVVIKPNNSDNSDGLSLVSTLGALPAALATAFAYSHSVLAETFVPLGREVRCGVVATGGQLRLLPLEEYRLDATTRPVRTHADKLQRDDGNALGFAAKDASQSWIVPTDDPIVAAVWDAARRCHIALGCEHYSLFDFRIDPLGQPWFLEAGLYCSFSPKSVLVAMMAAAGTPLNVFFDAAVQHALQTSGPPKPLPTSAMPPAVAR